MASRENGTFIIAKSRLFREGVRMLLNDSSFPVIAEAGSLEEGRDICNGGIQSDLILVDAPEHPNSIAQLKLMEEIREKTRGKQLVILSDQISLEHLRKCLAIGADGYLLKDMSPEAWRQSLSLVLLGEKVFPSFIGQILAKVEFESDTRLRDDNDLKILTERELQILTLLVKGYPNKTIANNLTITEGTVKVHLKTLLRKLHVSNRTQAALWAQSHGLNE